MIISGTSAANRDAPFILWDNVLARGAVSSIHPASGWENLAGPQTFDVWSWNVGSNSYVQAIFDEPEPCDCAAIAGHNLHKIGGSLRAQYSLDGVTGWVSVSAINTPADGDPAAIIFPEVAARGWRLLVTRPTGVFSVNLGFLGKRLILPAPVLSPYVAANCSARREFAASVSMGGHYMGGSSYSRGLEMDVQFAPVPRSFVDAADFRAFLRHFNNGGTFFFGADPLTLPGDLGYYWRAGEELRPSLRGGNFWADIKWSAAGYAG